MKKFITGFLLPFQGAAVLWRAPGAKLWALAPVLAAILVYSLLLLLLIWGLGGTNWFTFDWHFWGGWGERLAHWVNNFGNVIRWLVVIPLYFFIAYFTFSLGCELLASPFNDILSEKIEKHLTGRAPTAGDWRLTAKALRLSLGSTFRILLRQLFWMTVTFPLVFVPFFGAAVWFLVNSFFTGVAYFDIAMARNFLTWPCKKAAIRENRLLLTGLGAALTLGLMLPMLGAALTVPLGVAGATRFYCGLDWRGIFARAGLEAPAQFAFPGKKAEGLPDNGSRVNAL